MQEHFNENYMESNTFPKASFSGTINNLSSLDLSKDGEFKALITGTLEIHGIKKDVSTEAIFTVLNGKINATSKMKIIVSDYGIDIPSVVREKIAKEIEVTVKANYELLDI